MVTPNPYHGGFPHERPGEWHHDMSHTLRRIAVLVQRGEAQISAHGYDEMAEDGILAGEVIDDVAAALWLRTTPSTRRALYSCATTGSWRQPHPRTLGHPERADIAGSAGHRLSA